MLCVKMLAVAMYGTHVGYLLLSIPFYGDARAQRLLVAKQAV